MTQPAPQPGSITLTGASGAKYQFELHRWGTSFNAVGGVYVVLRRDPDGYKVLYVGETGDLSSRFDNHHQESCFDRQRKTHLAVRGEVGADRRRMIEADIRQYYDPPCNQQ